MVLLSHLYFTLFSSSSSSSPSPAASFLFLPCFHLLFVLFLLSACPCASILHYCLFLAPPIITAYVIRFIPHINICLFYVCVSSVTCCQRLPIRSVKMASGAVTLTALFSDALSLHTGFGHEGHTLRSSRCAFAFTFCLMFCIPIVSMIYLT